MQRRDESPCGILLSYITPVCWWVRQPSPLADVATGSRPIEPLIGLKNSLPSCCSRCARYRTARVTEILCTLVYTRAPHGALVAGEYGKAAFDAVGPLLLIGWAEVGPGFLQAISASTSLTVNHHVGNEVPNAHRAAYTESDCPISRAGAIVRATAQPTRRKRSPEALLVQARHADTTHRTVHQKPISADTLRVHLRIGATQARRLVKLIRAEFHTKAANDPPSTDTTREVQRFDPAVA